jgi:carbon-monoxide dehydrogenase iron sulfur subunit
MVCPFGVIRYHEDTFAPLGKTIAVKCDNCFERQEKGLVPACVETCKTGALLFEDINIALADKTSEVSRTASLGAREEVSIPLNPVLLLKQHKVALETLKTV